MEVILIENVPTLGSIGEVVKVKPGYARNYLLPQKLGILASANSKKQLAHQQRLITAKRATQREADEAIAARLKGAALTLARRVGEQGKLYGSVTVSDVEVVLKDAGFAVDRRCIQMGHAIKDLGTYDVVVKLSKEVAATVKLNVVAADL